MKEVSLKIQCCNRCPHFKSERYYTEDSWEYVIEWKCGNMRERHIYYMEAFDKEPEIPDWCPLEPSN
jgi:hypothetical protein